MNNDTKTEKLAMVGIIAARPNMHYNTKKIENL